MGFRIPLPRTDAEFAAVSNFVFGEVLRVRMLSETYYELLTPWGSYAHKALSQAVLFLPPSADGGNQHYRLNTWFCAQVFGEIQAGGIGVAAYGAFVPRGYRAVKRIRYWIQQRSGSRPDQLRPSFARLAARSRTRREQPDSR